MHHLHYATTGGGEGDPLSTRTVSFPEQPVGERGDQGNHDEQPVESFESGQDGQGIVERCKKPRPFKEVMLKNQALTGERGGPAR